MLLIYFNGWFSGFFEGTNPGLTVNFFIKLFENVYNEECCIGNFSESQILCEFDMLIGCSGSLVGSKCWKNTYLFSGESSLKCEKGKYDVVLWGERNNKNVVNLPLFVPFLYTRNLVEKIQEYGNIKVVPEKDVCVIISNPGGYIRNKFCTEVEKYFKVDYAGNYNNNIGGPLSFDYGTEEFYNFLRGYKFIISMENSIEDTYITEKITHGILSGIIPVYWGTNRVKDYFNCERFLFLENEEMIPEIISKMIHLSQNKEEWLKVANSHFLKNAETFPRDIHSVSKDVKKIIGKSNTLYDGIEHIYCLNSPLFEPERHKFLSEMFCSLGVDENMVTYLSPTYKHTITEEIYNKYTFNQKVLTLRSKRLTYAELSLFFNYMAILQHIEENFKEGSFLVFESDVMQGKDIRIFSDFLKTLKTSQFDYDLISIGLFHEEIYHGHFFPQLTTGYREKPEDMNPEILKLKDCFKIDDFGYKVVRKFHTKCTDSFIWSYKGVVKFLNWMKTFTDFSSPFDYYFTNFFEKNIDFKHYWAVEEFFVQRSNLGLTCSTLDR